jgi:hypothetical protein
LLTTDGLHEPTTPFDDVLGNVGTLAPAQIVELVPKLNVGVTFGFTTTVNIPVFAHCPDSGINR